MVCVCVCVCVCSFIPGLSTPQFLSHCVHSAIKAGEWSGNNEVVCVCVTWYEPMNVHTDDNAVVIIT